MDVRNFDEEWGSICYGTFSKSSYVKKAFKSQVKWNRPTTFPFENSIVPTFE